jgi:hypothetical protein
MRNKVYNFKTYSDGLKNNEFETKSCQAGLIF